MGSMRAGHLIVGHSGPSGNESSHKGPNKCDDMALPDSTTIEGSLYKLALTVEKLASVDKSFSGKIKTPGVAKSIDKWASQKANHTSITNIIMTAAWVKWLDNKQNIQLMFVRDAGGQPIKGAFNGRTMDEKYTVPLISEFSIHTQYCSRNSGFQGSRKSENLNTDHIPSFSRDTISSKVRWDIDTCFDIIEGINKASHGEAKTIFAYLLEKGFTIKKKIIEEQESAKSTKIDTSNANAYHILTLGISKVKDPQFHKALVASLLIEKWGGNKKVSVRGLSGSKTSSDQQAGSPGDLWLEWNSVGEVIEGIEVKDPTISFNFQHLAAAQDRISQHPEMRRYTLVTTGLTALPSHESISPIRWQIKITEIFHNYDTIVRTMTFADMLHDWRFSINYLKVINGVTTLLSKGKIPDIKQGTLKKWLALIEQDSAK